jgi:hypothetical protein
MTPQLMIFTPKRWLETLLLGCAYMQPEYLRAWFWGE